MSMDPSPMRLRLWDVPIDVISRDEALHTIDTLSQRHEPAFVAFANAHVLNLAAGDDEYRDVLNKHALVLNDGIGAAIAARMFRVRFPDNLNGTDLSPLILADAARRGDRVAFIGAAPGVSEIAADQLKRDIPGLRVEFTSHGYLSASERDTLVATLDRREVNMVLVGMGCPIQEKWALNHLADSGVAVVLSVGAFFDFAAQRVPRAPAIVRKLHLEWAFRLANEPRRLFRRYVIGNPEFIIRATFYRLRHSRERVCIPAKCG